MKRWVWLLLIAAAMLAFAAPVLAQDAYYVQSMKAKVMSAPSFKSTVLGEVSKGHKLSALGKEGSWVKVLYNTKEGYVSTLLVSTTPPMARIGLIKGDEADIQQGARRRASTYTSAAAARGLTHEDRRRMSAEEEVDYKALEKMEAFTVSADELAKFMEGGK